MSKEQQQYQSSQLKLRKQLVQDMLKGTNYPNNEFYPFHVPPQNYLYNYMFPYPPSPFFPLYSPPFMPPIDTRNKFDHSYTRIEDREESSMKHQKIKPEPAQQKDYLIKIQELMPKNKQISEQMESIKPPEKKIKKQLYKAQMNPNSPAKYDQEVSELQIKFKRLIQDHVHGVIQQIFDISFYEHQFADLIAENRHFFEGMMKALLKRFRQYKKTKQELIKLIIRRTYHALKHHKNILCQKPEYERLQAFHYKNLTTFKSMNVHFLRREFSNPLLVQLFKEFLENFQDQFQRENGQKIQRYATILVTCWYQKSTKLLLSQRKLPWANSYKQRIKKISLQLLKEHEGLSTSNDSEPRK